MRKIPFGWIAYFVLAAALIAVEGGFFLDPESKWKRYAALFWLGLSVAFLASTWVAALGPFFQRAFWSSRHSTWYVAAVFVPASLILLDFAGITFNRIDGESTLQQFDGLNLLRNQNSLGIYDMAFLAGTYPDRQYALACLPGYFFGPGIITYRIGYAVLYIGAYWSFLAAVRRYLESRKAPEPLLLTGYVGTMVALAIYPLIAARLFEQLIMPLTATMYFLAGALFFGVKRTPYAAFWLTWTVGLFPYCYSAAMASWALAILILIYVAWQPGYRVAIVALVYGICAGATSLWMQYQHGMLKGKLAVGQDIHFTTWDWVWRYITATRAVAGTDESIIPQPLVLSLLVTGYLCWRQREWRFFVVGAWALATVVAALTFEGYCWRSPAADVSRSMAILPPLSLAVVLAMTFHAKEWFAAEATRRIIILFLMISMIFMLCNSVTIPLLRRQIRDNPVEVPTDFDEGVYDLSIIVHTRGLPPVKRIYLIPPLDFAMEDGARYLTPDAVVIRGNPPPGEKIEGTYLFSYRSKNPDDLNWIQDMPEFHPRPYIVVRLE